MASPRHIEIHAEAVGEPYTEGSHVGQTAVIVGTVSYRKGAGYELSVRVEKRGDGVSAYLLFTGIHERKRLAQATRFGKARLKAEADGCRDTLTEMVEVAKKELARRVEVGEDF